MPLSTPEPQNTLTESTQRGHDITICDSKNASFRSYSTFVYLLRVHIYPQYKYAYVHNYSAHGHELSGCVRADADAYIRVCIVLLCSLHGLGPGPVMCMIRERHVILKAALHSRLAV